ncbi:MAG: U32 family peptidase [Deltaproteobacteria bacterium]|nr:MAG: U32 family peptidase [Deltaproteobacteria bacterium]TMB33871.1 MAG: U32 family peptidase [Deltaproteobacteria bacterium]
MTKAPPRPELLAPAGDEESLRAAVAAGADAVYFGLRGGFNARARADNFAVADLPRIFDFLRARGVKGFVTFNTLVFDRELPVAEAALADIARAGADAILVQDLGIARLAHEVCPELPLHASTQMTVSSAEAAAIAKSLGVTRVVLPRELSIDEIRTMAMGTDLELECFVHGALCVSWSGQCLTSEALQHRSANRGQCAQSCRMPYDLVVDGKVETARGDEQLKYLLSPRDLAAYDLLPQLIDAGVCCFKIEGRMKGPEYVANAVDKYRRALDAALEHRPYPLQKRDEEELRYSFSRSFSHGFFRGSDHQALVHGLYPGHRGVLVGRVEEVHARAGRVVVRAEPDAPELKAGDRILFDQGKPEDDEPRGGLHACDVVAPGLLRMLFGGPDQGSLDLRLVKAGDVVWKAKDAEVTRKMKRVAARERKVGLTLSVRGAAGTALIVTARDDLGRAARVESAMPLQLARVNPLHEGLVREKLCAFGETGFELRRLELELEGALAMPPSELKRLRRAVVQALVGSPPPQPARHVRTGLDPDAVVAPLSANGSSGAPKLIPLLRTLGQVEVALRLGFDELQLDFMELVGLGVAVERARARGAKVIVATPRVQKPGEEGYDRRFERLRPDGILARHLGAVEHFRRNPHTETVHGDFSLNATNALTARTLLGLGLSTLTPAYDLDLAQLLDLASGVPAERLEVTIHQHLPLFHNEHCVYSHLLSNGHDYRDCGRPCEKHLIRLRDGLGMEHPVIVDVGCRNTVFNARAQSAAACLPQLLAAGVRRFRVELVRESEAETERVLRAYAALLAGKRTGPQVIAQVGALEKYGVSAGTLVVVTQPHV